MHWCVNVVCGTGGPASAVLLRAGEVVRGLELAAPAARRGADRDLARGPARLAPALGSRAQRPGRRGARRARGVRAASGCAGRRRPAPAVRSGRGSGSAAPAATGRYPWRFWLDGEPDRLRVPSGRDRRVRRRTAS